MVYVNAESNSTASAEAIASDVRIYGHLIGGDSVASEAPRIERHDPATGIVVAEYENGGEVEVDAAVAAARREFDEGEWPRLTGAERGKLLDRFAVLVDGHRDLLAALDCQEVGKPMRLAEAEIGGVIGHIEYAAALARTDHGTAWTQLEDGFLAYSSQVPLGVAALIVPWNFPALIVSQKLPYALASGCTVVIKPSEMTSSSAVEIVRLAHAAGIPTDAVNLVLGYGETVGSALVTHAGVDVVSFTGSTATGRRVAALAGEGLKRVGLELGGKAANLVFADADFEEAAAAAAHAAFVNQGECCVAATRLLVERSIADRFLEAVVAHTRSLAVGLPTDPATDIGPLISHQHAERVVGYIETGNADPAAELLTGGRRLEDGVHARGAFVEPTVFAGVQPGTKLFDEEVFGPVLVVERFEGIAEAARLANATEYGLANAVWTTSLDTATAISDALRSGTVWVNTNIDGAPALAFGGMKNSGIGREVGVEGMREFTESKTVQIRRGGRELPFPRRGEALR